MLGVAKVLIIIGSIRQQRICPQVAEWVAQIGRETLNMRCDMPVENLILIMSGANFLRMAAIQSSCLRHVLGRHIQSPRK
jgi:hypothetical protein